MDGIFFILFAWLHSNCCSVTITTLLRPFLFLKLIRCHCSSWSPCVNTLGGAPSHTRVDMQILMPQRNTEAFPCRRGSEIAVDRCEAPKFLDVNSSLSQRDNLQWRLRELLQAKEQNQQDLLRQDQRYNELLREDDLLWQRRLDLRDPYYGTLTQRRIREDLQDVQRKRSLLLRDQDILRQDQARIERDIWKVEWERQREPLRAPLSSSRRPESAPRSGDFAHSASRARAERSHTPIPALKMRQQSAPQSPAPVKPDTFDGSFPPSLSSLPARALPLLPPGHLAQPLTFASPQIRTSPNSSPSHSLAPVTNMASATASTEATLQDMQDTVLPDLADPLKERLQEHELWLGMMDFEALTIGLTAKIRPDGTNDCGERSYLYTDQCKHGMRCFIAIIWFYGITMNYT